MTSNADHHDTSLTVPAVGISVLIFNSAGHVLLARRRKDHGHLTYGAPGGGLHHGETPPESARRQAHEKADITLSTPQVVCLTNFQVNGRHYLDIAFTAWTEDTPRHRKPDATEPWQWYPLDQLPDPLFLPTAKAIASYKDGQMYNW